MNNTVDSGAGRSERIDTMRGLACLLLVLYHVIGESPATGLRLDHGHPLALFNSVLVYLRMPMFAFLSGMVYARRPFKGGYSAFLSGKFRRLIVPMLIVGTLFFGVQRLTPGANIDLGPWQTMHLRPVAHFWFLEAMFWIFALVALLEGRQWLSRPAGLLVAAILAWVVAAAMPPLGWLGLDGTLYLLPYFLIGIFTQRFGVNRVGFAVAATVGAAGIAWVVWALAASAPLPGRVSVQALAIGAAACLLMNAARWQVHWLARIGAYSFGIYMFHVFFAAACRITLMHAGVAPVGVLAAAGLAAGVLGPVALELAVRRAWPWGYRWVFGVRARPGQAGHAGA